MSEIEGNVKCNTCGSVSARGDGYNCECGKVPESYYSGRNHMKTIMFSKAETSQDDITVTCVDGCIMRFPKEHSVVLIDRILVPQWVYDKTVRV